jgi:hypothetical protein
MENMLFRFVNVNGISILAIQIPQTLGSCLQVIVVHSKSMTDGATSVAIRIFTVIVGSADSPDAFLILDLP